MLGAGARVTAMVVGLTGVGSVRTAVGPVGLVGGSRHIVGAPTWAGTHLELGAQHGAVPTPAEQRRPVNTQRVQRVPTHFSPRAQHLRQRPHCGNGCMRNSGGLQA